MLATMGRLEPLRRLFASLEGQLEVGDCIAIATTGDQYRVGELVKSFRFPDGCVTLTASPKGASTARNLAAASLATKVDFLLFPNDTSWFASGFVKTFRGLDLTGSCGALEVVDEKGPKFLLPEAGTPLSKANVWQVIEPGLFIKCSTFFELGGFNEDFGTGAPTPWQSGEGTELLVRWMDRYDPQSFEWIHKLKVYGISDPFGLSALQRRRKLRAYARGYGRLLITGGFSGRKRIEAALGGWLFGLRKGAPYKAVDGLWVGLGRLEGMTGVVLSGAHSSVRAVDQ